MTDLYLSTKKGQFDKVIRKIRKKYVISTANSKLDEIILNCNDIKPRSKEFQSIKSELEKMSGIVSVISVKGHLKVKNATLKESLSTNQCRIIFDVDSTITRGGSTGTIHPSIPKILQKIQDKGIWVYVATGRSLYDLVQIVNNNPVEKTSISENGGIILGFTAEGYVEHGSKTEPNKVLEYLQKKYKIREDMKQGERITEVILLHSDVTREQIDEAISETNAKVSVHMSQNSYHISKKDVDKGSAILELGRRLKWGNSFKIAVGDSQMDVSMFEACDYSFAPKNADQFAKEACIQELNGNYEKAIENLYDLIVKSN